MRRLGLLLSVLAVGAALVLSLSGGGLKQIRPPANQSVDQSGTWTLQAVHQAVVSHVSAVLHVAVIRDFSGASATGRVCHSQAAFSTSANAIIAHGASGLRLFVCGFVLSGPWPSSGQQRVSLVEGTGAACATGTAALLGSTDAANGMALAHATALSIVQPTPWIATATAANQLCVLLGGGGAVAVSGAVLYGAY